jgi:predicted nucleic acid-binding protein
LSSKCVYEELRNFFEITDVEKPDFEEAWEFFKAQKETKFSFTDCTTIAMMRRKDISNMATFNKAFRKIKSN